MQQARCTELTEALAFNGRKGNQTKRLMQVCVYMHANVMSLSIIFSIMEEREVINLDIVGVSINATRNYISHQICYI